MTRPFARNGALSAPKGSPFGQIADIPRATLGALVVAAVLLQRDWAFLGNAARILIGGRRG